MPHFLTETHCHTNEVSRCANVRAEDMIEAYIEKGYSTVVITDHMSRLTFPEIDKTRWEDYVNYYLAGYKNALKAAKGRINVLLGMEITLYENNNDYLLFGITEEFITKHTNLMEKKIHKLSALARENGILVFQAHPFRTNMTVVKTQLLDGIEVYNGNSRHDSRNDIANEWADKYKLFKSSGSDYHEVEDVGRGGIITDFEIKTNDDLLKALKGNCKIKETNP